MVKSALRSHCRDGDTADFFNRRHSSQDFRNAVVAEQLHTMGEGRIPNVGWHSDRCRKLISALVLTLSGQSDRKMASSTQRITV
jgi:hypothetical protein